MNKTADSSEHKTRDKILTIAEQMFADKGVDAVSLRGINAACGVSPGVLHYHFGNREGLLIGILQRRMDPLMALRRERIMALMDSETVSIEQVVRMLVEPLASFIDEDGQGGRAYIKLISRLYADNHPVFEQISRQYIEQGNHHIPGLIARACPHIAAEQIPVLLGFCNTCMLQTLAQQDGGPKHWQGTEQGSEVELLIKFLSQGFGQ